MVQCTNYSTTLSASTSVSWITSSGTRTLLPAIEEVTTSTSTYINAEVLYFMNPTDGSGTLAVSGIGDGSEVNAFTMSGVNTAATPSGFGNYANATSVAVPLSSPAAGSMAVVTGGWREGNLTSYSLTASAGPNPTIQWGPLCGAIKRFNRGCRRIPRESCGGEPYAHTNAEQQQPKRFRRRRLRGSCYRVELVRRDQ